MSRLNKEQLGDYSFEFSAGNPEEYGEEAHRVNAIHNPSNSLAGFMEWDPGSGHILNITTMPEHRRRGVATGMFLHAQSQKGIVKPIHSTIQSEEGKAWADSL
jgi:ribosomal protein S18 acetylase RimI-like enzyme